MKIKFLRSYQPKQGDGQGPKYTAGQVVNFKGPVEETYAAKYVRLGLAEEFDETAARAADRKIKDEEDAKAEADTKAKADAEAKAKSEADAKAKAEAAAKAKGANPT
jgi:parvulin-like peptidyl-prolyl isomerase